MLEFVNPFNPTKSINVYLLPTVSILQNKWIGCENKEIDPLYIL